MVTDSIFWAFIGIFPGIAVLPLFMKSRLSYSTDGQSSQLTLLKPIILGFNLLISLSLSFYTLSIFSKNVSVGFISLLIFFSTISFFVLFLKGKAIIGRFLICFALIVVLLNSTAEFFFPSISEFNYGHGRFLSSDMSAYLWPMGGPLFWLVSPLHKFELNPWISTSAISTALLLFFITMGPLRNLHKLILITMFLSLLAVIESITPTGSKTLAQTGGYTAIVFSLAALYGNWEFNKRRQRVVNEEKRNELEASRIEFFLLLSPASLTTGVYGSVVTVLLTIISIVIFRKKLRSEFRFFSIYPIPVALFLLNLILLLTEYYRRFLMG